MKLLYWKFLLILGAMVVGASLVVPKALRKSAERVTAITAQTIFLENTGNTTFNTALSAKNIKPTIIVDTFDALTSSHYTDVFNIKFEIVVRLIVKIIAPTHSLSAGIMPVKSRVID